MSFRRVVWVVWQISGIQTCVEAMSHDTAILNSIVSRGQWLHQACTYRSKSLQWQTPKQWKHHGSSISQNSFIIVSSGSWKLSTGDLSPETKTSPNHKRPSGCKLICYLHEQNDERNCFSFHFLETKLLCAIYVNVLWLWWKYCYFFFLFFLAYDELFWQTCWAPLHSGLKQNQRGHRSLQQSFISCSERK